MDLRKFESGASATPPSAPASPSVGYATKGNPATPVPATVPGEYWFHQVAEELRAAVVGAGLTPDNTVLNQLWLAIQAMATVPLGAVPYPHIDTSDNKLNVTSASAAAGGTVSIPAATELALGVEITAGKTGRYQAFTTAAWTSADLLASSTYYLRAMVSGGVLTPYVQRGTDSDSIPVGLKGTPNGASGGGFDSTVLDILLAKVVTGSAGSTPTVTKLANARQLLAHVSDTTTPTLVGSNNYEIVGSWSLNWARAPRVWLPTGHVGGSGGGAVEAYANRITNRTSSRYTVTATIDTDWDSTRTGLFGEVRGLALA